MNLTFDPQAIAQLGQAIGAELRAGVLSEVMPMFHEHGQRLQAIEDALRMQRRNIPDRVKAEIAAETQRQGGRCPCCMRNYVVDEAGNPLPSAEFDHFFASHMADADSCWLICIGCHNEITPWRASDTKTHKSDVTAQFEAFQNRRRRWLVGR